MNSISRIVLSFFLTTSFFTAQSQHIERTIKPNIATVQLYTEGDQQSMPAFSLNNPNKIKLSFDDLEGGYKNYYYTFVLCDYNWNQANLSEFDYIKGFTKNRISFYRYSNTAYTKYTHYEALLPEDNSLPTRSGNYLLKVFLDGDTTKLVFTKQFIVFEQKASIDAMVVQTYASDKFRTHQRIKFKANLKDLKAFSPAQEVKTVILQNNRWDNAQKDIRPTFVTGNILDYVTEDVAVFPGEKEWRWLDVRSFRLNSDRIESQIYNQNERSVQLKTDIDRREQRYMYYADLNGSYEINTYENINPLWQSDYSMLHFSFQKNGGGIYKGDDVFLIGQFTNYEINDKWKLMYNPLSDKYECSAYLKQGYYNYTYVLAEKNNYQKLTSLDGNYWETENKYTILMYYKSFSDRNDRIIGVAAINSRSDKPGFSF